VAPLRPLSTAPLKKEPEDIFSGLDTASEPPSEGAMDLEPPPRRSPLMFVLLAVLIIMIVGGAGAAVWYFLIREPSTALIVETQPSSNPPIVTSDSEPVVETPPALPPESGSQNPPPNIPPPESITPTPEEPPPAVVLAEASDSDGDGLSDPEEAMIGTEATMQDSDGDGFGDGAELSSGYDPTTPRLAISASPRFRLATIGSSLQVNLPAAWTVGADTTSPGSEAIQTGTPTTFSVRTSPLPEGTTFMNWYAANEPMGDATSLRSITTKQGYRAYQTSDRLQTYIEIPGSIVIVTYRPNASASYDFRALYEYVIQTIRLR
jgi:hypothetical protein